MYFSSNKKEMQGIVMVNMFGNDHHEEKLLNQLSGIHVDSNRNLSPKWTS